VRAHFLCADRRLLGEPGRVGGSERERGRKGQRERVRTSYALSMPQLASAGCVGADANDCVGFRVQGGVECRVEGEGCRVQGLGCRV